MTVGGLVLATGAIALLATGAAVAAGLPVAADDLTLVRIPGAVPERSCTITAVADAHVDEAQPDAAFGAGPAVEVASGPTGRRALVRFDIGACEIPAGAEVRAGRLAMTLTDGPAESRVWELRRVTVPWAEPAVTWNAAPTVTATATDTAPTGTVPGATLEWDVLADVVDVVAGTATDDGWRIGDAAEGAPATVGGALASREAATAGHRPTLTIRWFD